MENYSEVLNLFLPKLPVSIYVVARIDSLHLESNDQHAKDCKSEANVFERVRVLIQINDTEDDCWHTFECLNCLHLTCLSKSNGVGVYNLRNVIQN